MRVRAERGAPVDGLDARVAAHGLRALTDDFDGDELDRGRWLPYYLPHWSSRERAGARYEIGGGRLRLLIAEDQPAWCPELDGELRVSSIQTGTLDGQHKFHPDAVVREPQPSERLYTPEYGRIEIRAKAPTDPGTMGALWLIGWEDEPERSGELCVCELWGHGELGLGIHPFGDPALVDDFSRLPLPGRAEDFHVYAADWTPERVVFSVDGAAVKTSEQSPAYPMQLMLSLYEFRGEAPEGDYPKEFVVDRIRVSEHE